MIEDFVDSPDEAAFRARVREWITDTLARIPPPVSADLQERLAYFREWQREVHGAGYAGLSWPREFGGQGATAMQQAIWIEELNRAQAPEPMNGIGERMAGPTIIEFGTDEQKRRFLPPILTGEEVWCQLFSEPNAGSDLASLQTRAIRGENGWRIDGQKVWTSRAQVADFAILLARTGEQASRHRGITYFLLPMRTPGVTVVPLRQITGESEFNEVFIEDVFVPDALMLGEVGGGWDVAKATLQHERAFVAMGRVDFGRWLDDLLEDVRAAVTSSGEPLGADATLRQGLARLYERVLTQRVTARRVITRVDSGQAPGPESSVGKLTLSQLMFELTDIALSVHGLAGCVDSAGRQPASRGAIWQQRSLFARGMALAGGTPQIQKNIIAERVLQLPRA